MGSGGKKSKTKETRQEALKKTNDELFARTGQTIDDVGKGRCTENAAGRRDYHASAPKTLLLAPVTWPLRIALRRPLLANLPRG